MTSINNIDANIDQLNKQLEKLKRERDELAAMAEDAKLAVHLHSKFCRWNHTDACSWFYEINRDGTHRWSNHAHSEYLSKANKLLSMTTGVSYETVIKIIDVLA